MPLSRSRLEELKAIGGVVRRLEERCSGFDPKAYGDGKGGAFDFSSQATLLQATLEAAVPLWADELLRLEKTYPRPDGQTFWDYLYGRCEYCSRYIAEHGDSLMFRDKKGRTAEAFNRLAEGIAIMAMCPGGVEFLGSRWEYRWVKAKEGSK